MTGGAILTDPKVSIVNADDAFGLEGLKAGYRIGILYDRYIDDEKKLGFRTGLNVVKKRYSTQFETVQSYREINNSSATLDVKMRVQPGHLVYELPISFLYKKSLLESNSFFSFAGGASLDLVRESVLETNFSLVLLNPQGIPQRFNVQTTDNFEFDSHLSYSLFISASYNFLLRSQRYVELGLSYHFSPVRSDILNITHNVNGEEFSASYQPQRLSYFQFFISYSLTRLEFNRYL